MVFLLPTFHHTTSPKFLPVAWTAASVSLTGGDREVVSSQCLPVYVAAVADCTEVY